MEKFTKYFLERARERSTWTGLTTLLAVIGLSLTPEQATAIATAGVSVIAAVYAFMPDTKS